MKPLLWIIIFVIIILGLLIFYMVRSSLHSSDNKVKILMGGRSTMGLWFKHWNWPYPLRIKLTYRSWPIPYNKYSHEKLFLEYLPLDEPNTKDPSIPFGAKMLKAFEVGLDREKYGAAFFKFCFVDFPVKEEEWQKRFEGLTKTVMAAHEMTAKRKMKLIIGNALPLLKPSDPTLRLQKAYNQWLQEFVAKHDDVRVFDFFGTLSDKSGGLQPDLARNIDDDHPNESAFSLLDKKFFKNVSDWFSP